MATTYSIIQLIIYYKSRLVVLAIQLHFKYFKYHIINKINF